MAEHSERLGPSRVAAYPYQDGLAGYVVRNPDRSEQRPGKRWALRAEVEGAYLGDRVWRSAVGVEASVWRVTLRNDTGFYLEQPRRDALYLGSTNVMFALVMRRHAQWRLGGGVNYMVDGRVPGQGPREHALGVNGTTSLDLMPIRPLIVSARADVGTLHAAPTYALRWTAGAALRRFELYGGYELRGVGRVPLDGPVLGLRGWF
ncbi:MAG: hypothetical protein K0V04_37365 [Deltaproteobacteria bacterium]|nr:hypothetical protein [Deltaproteobacteria bacterium]